MKLITHRYIIFRLLLLVVFLAVGACNNDGRDDPGPTTDVLPEAYHDLDEIDTAIDSLVSAYPSIVAKGSIGTSGEGRDIPVIIISDNPANREESEPRVKFVGGVHGNEIISIELMVRFARYLAENYSGATKDLIDSRYIVIVPVLNPDGYNKGIRYNASGVDLNRNCSVIYEGTDKFLPSSIHGDFPFSEPESQALRDYTLEADNGNTAPFHLSATFHSGAVIVNMPFDFAEDEITAPAEYETVKEFAWVYSTAGNYAFRDQPNLLSISDVIDGIVNGGDWYIVNGSIQDWNYLSAGCLDLTIELNANKAGPDTEDGIDDIFSYNEAGLLDYIDAAGRGVSGTVTDGTDPLEGVSVYIKDTDFGTDGDQPGDLVTKTDSNGWFHKIHFPTVYPDSIILVFEKDGYATEYSTAIELTDAEYSKAIADIVMTEE